MPTLSMFFGILIRMYKELNGQHNVPHFHAGYAEYEAVYDFEGNVLEGNLPKKQHNLVVAWVEIHRDELEANWKLLCEDEPFFKIRRIYMDKIIKGNQLTPRVKQVEATDNYELILTFNTGERKKFDAKTLFQYPMYAPLKNIGFFKLVKADNMCVYWNDDIDICPDALYMQSIPM